MSVNSVDVKSTVIVPDEEGAKVVESELKETEPNSIWQSKEFFKHVGFGAYFGAVPGSLFYAMNAIAIGEKMNNPDISVIKAVKNMKKSGVSPSEIKKFIKPFKIGGLVGAVGLLVGALTGYAIYKHRTNA